MFYGQTNQYLTGVAGKKINIILYRHIHITFSVQPLLVRGRVHSPAMLYTETRTKMCCLVLDYPIYRFLQDHCSSRSRPYDELWAGSLYRLLHTYSVCYVARRMRRNMPVHVSARGCHAHHESNFSWNLRKSDPLHP